METKNNKPDMTAIVAKSNELITQMAKFELSELRLIAYCLAHYDSRKEDNRIFTARVSDLTDIFPMNKKCAYAVVRKAMLGINKKPLEFKENDDEHIFLNWFEGFKYNHKTQKFTFTITPGIRPYLLALKGNFTYFRLQDVYQFRAASTWKLYELLKRWLNKKYWSVELDELRLLLGVPGKYATWSNLKQWLIDPSIKEINEKSDLFVSYEKEKEGRRVSGLIFHIDKKQSDDVINLESDQDKLYKALLSHGINHKTALDYAQKCESKDCTKVILKKLPEIVKRTEKTAVSTTAEKNKSTVIKYILGAIKNELKQGQLFLQESESVSGVQFVTREQVAERGWAFTGESWDECIARLRKSRIIVQEVTR